MEFKMKLNKMEFVSFCELVKSCMTINQMDIATDADKSTNAIAERVYNRSVLMDLMMKLARRAMEVKSKNKISLNKAESFVVFNMFGSYPLGVLQGLELSVLLQVRGALERWYMEKESEIKSGINYELQQV